MMECPKCHYVRTAIDAQINSAICPSCGIVYSKWIARHEPQNILTSIEIDDDESITLRQKIREYITYVPENIDPLVFWGRVITLGVFIIWGFYFISAGVNWEKIGGSFLHNPNLAFHEFGHIFFAPFGLFMTILGGSLFQILWPLFLMGAFMWKQRDNFAASLMLWWCGQNFIDVSPYIDDAQYRVLPLVGGGGEESHDWGNLLTMMNMLGKTHAIAQTCFTIGALIIILSIVWSIYILRLQKKNLLVTE